MPSFEAFFGSFVTLHVELHLYRSFHTFQFMLAWYLAILNQVVHLTKSRPPIIVRSCAVPVLNAHEDSDYAMPHHRNTFTITMIYSLIIVLPYMHVHTLTTTITHANTTAK